MAVAPEGDDQASAPAHLLAEADQLAAGQSEFGDWADELAAKAVTTPGDNPEAEIPPEL